MFGGLWGAAVAGFSGEDCTLPGIGSPAAGFRLTSRRRSRGFGVLRHSYGRYKPPAPWAFRRTLTFNSLQTKCQSRMAEPYRSSLSLFGLIAFDQLTNAQGVRFTVAMAGDRRCAA